MELFKKKTATDNALDILANALHDNEISSFIVMIKKRTVRFYPLTETFSARLHPW